MTSNTSLGRGHKGSKFWIQTLVNLDGGAALSKKIQKESPDIGKIVWCSPLKVDYQELKTHQIKGIDKEDLDFWPDNGPQWDGVGIDEQGCILLVEAKGHPKETLTKCSASSPKSISQIKQSMETAHNMLATDHQYQDEIWFSKYYQLGNRLTFLEMLRTKGKNVRLVLLNIVNDPTHIKTTEDQWAEHYEKVFGEMLGHQDTPESVIIVNFCV